MTPYPVARSIALLSSVTLGWGSLAIAPVLAGTAPETQSIPQASSLNLKQWFGQPQRQRLGDASGRSRSGSHRGSCGIVPQIGMAALMPGSNAGLTTDASPTFWFYMPYDRSSGVEGAKFMLLDEALRPAIADPIAVPLPAAPGVISFQLPDNVAPLEVGHRYNWYFSVVCDAEKPSRNPVVSGWVERVAPDATLTAQLRTAPEQQDYLVYGENGIWFNALTQLAQQRCRNPQDTRLTEDWNSLLEQTDMADLANQPLICDVNADQPDG